MFYRWQSRALEYIFYKYTQQILFYMEFEFMFFNLSYPIMDSLIISPNLYSSVCKSS